MPLVTITCSRDFYPPDGDLTDVRPDQTQCIALELAEFLPGMIADNATRLDLNPDDTPPEGVQVDIKKFHGRAVNAVHFWIHVQFAEPYPGKAIAAKVRDTFIEMLTKQWLEGRSLGGSYAVDIFWGPDHGCLMSEQGKIEITW
jgi:hypothetical protein